LSGTADLPGNQWRESPSGLDVGCADAETRRRPADRDPAFALVLPTASAVAGSTIDTTGFATNTAYDLASDSGPPFNDKLGSEIAQTFVPPSGAQAITRISVLAASAAAQPVTLKLYTLAAGVPDAEIKTATVSLDAGARSLRSFDVAWPILAVPYAFAIGAAPDTVTGNSSLTLPNVGGADGRNVYAGGQVFTRQLLSPPVSQPWDPHADIDVKFRIDFDGGVTTGGGGGGGTGGGGTTPTATPTPAPTPAPTTTTPYATPTLPAKPLALKAARGKPKIPATFACSGAALSGCALTVTPPKGARSVKVDVLRGSKVVASGAASRKTAGSGKRRTLRLAAKGPLASGVHTVRLTVVTAKGRTVRQTATFTA